MVIETGRLRIVPLDADMLETLSRDVKEFEREYDAKYDGESINDELKSILGRCAEEVREDEDNKVFLTTWLIELKGVLIGSIVIKGLAKGGETEISYCLNNKGMLKLAALLGLNRVFAETREDNVKSEKVLERCGFDLVSDGKLKKWGKNL